MGRDRGVTDAGAVSLVVGSTVPSVFWVLSGKVWAYGGYPSLKDSPALPKVNVFLSDKQLLALCSLLTEKILQPLPAGLLNYPTPNPTGKISPAGVWFTLRG